MNRDIPVVLRRRVSVGEIAEMAGVRPSAVSNWRSRHSDFPLPVEKSAGGDLFDMESVVGWLQARGKEYEIPEVEWDRLLWKELDAVRRGGIELEQAVLLMLQLLFLRSAAKREISDARVRALDLMQRVPDDPRRAEEAWRTYVDEVSLLTAPLNRVLEPTHRVDSEHLVGILQTVDQVIDEGVDTGEIATALIQLYQEAIGIRGVSSTPRSLTDLQVGLLEPIKGTVYDPAAGTAMVLADAWRRRANDDVKLVGQEVNEYAWRIAYLHLALLGANIDLRTGDTLLDDRFRSLRAERIALEPPFGSKPSGRDLFGDPRWAFGVPRSADDWLWAQHLISHLAEDGIGVMTAPLGALFRGGTEATVRAGVVEAGLLEAVIELPPGLLAGTSIPIALLVFSRRGANRDSRVLFVNGSQLGKSRRGKLHELEAADVARIVTAVGSWRDGNWKEEVRFTAAATTEEVLANGADLSPKRYVRFSTRVTEIDGEAIPDRFERLRAEHTAAISALDVAGEDLVRAIEALSAPSSLDGSMVRLGDLLTSEPRAGTRQDTAGDGESIPYVSTQLVTGESGRLDAVPEEVTCGNTRGRLVTRNDLLLTSRGITGTGQIGCVRVNFDVEAAYSDSLLRISPDLDRVHPDYLRLFLTSRQGRNALVAATTGSVISNLRPDVLMEIEIHVPDLDTQRKIVSALHRVEDGVAGLRRALDSSEDVLDTIREGIVGGIFAPAAT